MIISKDDLKTYLAEDKWALGRKSRHPSFNDLIWKYQIILRKAEYYNNCHSLLNRLLYNFYRYKRHKLGVKLGFTIPLNVCGKGLCISHIGCIVISDHAVIGDYCRIHVGVNIGSDARIRDSAPVIGDYCYIGPGAKIFGAITIGNNVAIGANSVVTKSFPDNCSIVGVPARQINDMGTVGIIERR